MGNILIFREFEILSERKQANTNPQESVCINSLIDKNIGN